MKAIQIGIFTFCISLAAYISITEAKRITHNWMQSW